MMAGDPGANVCLNCGADLTGSFCAHCGQKNLDLNVSIGHIISDFLGDIFSYDSRVFRTLVPLLFRPGFLTLQFNRGRRVHYVPPVRLFIIISLLYFFSFSLAGFEGVNIVITQDGQASVTAPAGALKNRVITGSEDTGKQPPAGSGIKPGDKDMVKDLVIRKIVTAGQNRELIMDKVTEWMPRLMFFLIPVFAFILKICYWKSGWFYIHHLIFSLHFHSFVFLLLFFLLPLSGAYDDLADIISVIVMAAYLLLSMIRVYAGRMIGTILKFMFLSFSYLCVFAATTISTLITIIILQE